MKTLLLPMVLAFGALTAHAERAPRLPTLSNAAIASEARVIVKFKADSSTLRARALSATAGRDSVALMLNERAGLLGSRAGVSLSSGSPAGERAQVVMASGITSEQLAARLSADAEVEYAEPDRRMTRLAVPNDPYFSSRDAAVTPDVGQWFLRAPSSDFASSINAVGAWNQSRGGEGNERVIVAVLDTGVRRDHPDLASKLVRGADMVADIDIANDGGGRDDDPSDPGDWVSGTEANTGKFTGCSEAPSSWHGTQVAGIVGAETDNGIGVAGTGWNVRVLPVRVLGKCYGNESDIAAGILWAAGVPVAGMEANATPARVINLSLGGTGSCGRTYQEAINTAVARGVTVVVAAGNSAGHAVGAPGNCANVITVGALRHVGTKVGYSDVGPQVTLSAPGGNCVNLDSGPCLYPIVTTFNTGATVPGASGYTDYVANSSVGTSFASPQVAAVAGLMLSSQPTLTPLGVKVFLQRGARAFPTTAPAEPGLSATAQCRAPNGIDQLECFCTTSTCGAGMLDAEAAVRLASTAAAVVVPVVSAPPTASAGEAFSASVNGTVEPSGREIASVRWQVISGPAALGTTATERTVTVLPSGSGDVVVQVSVTDVLGFQSTGTATVAVSSAGTGGSGGGGGAVSLAWLLGLAAACTGLLRRRLHP
ncbi:S8 family peptidase [Aquincola tertiaricarbonis]|uniref:S8 family peptidase n=1 Tax=Aquincola tertiaricarbonis TaxID=391953 RepID=UPI0009F9F8BE|nr:S8 family peptidase [Aquincola tertiaricarbonis]